MWVYVYENSNFKLFLQLNDTIMKTPTSLKLKLISFFSVDNSISNKDIEIKNDKKSVVTLRTISKEEIEKNRCSQYEYAL